MTDRVNALTVVLEHDIRDDDIAPLVSALKHLKGVLSVDQHVTNLEDHIAETRARHELGKKLFEVLHPSKKQGE